MKICHKKVEIPEGEDIVSTTTFGGHHRWDFKFPFKHYVEPRYLIATKNAIYEISIVRGGDN